MKIKILILFVIAFVNVFWAHAVQVTQNDALTIVKRSFQNKDVDYYIKDNTTGNTWSIYVDGDPLKGWPHTCYYIDIPKSITGAISDYSPVIETKQYAPMEVYSPLQVKNRYGSNANSKPSLQNVSSPNQINGISGRTYAIILSGGISPMNNYQRYWNDCSFIYQALRKRYNIPKNNIYPLMSDGNNPAKDMISSSTGQTISQSLDLDFDGNNEIQFSATKANLKKILDLISKVIEKDDHLFLFVIDHGGSTDMDMGSYICLWNNEILHDYELTSMLKPFSQKFVNLNVVLGQCFSGGFIDNLESLNCVVAAACAGNESSYSCGDIPYDEFVYHWTCAVSGTDHLGNGIVADSDDNGYISMSEAFEYAKSKDRRQQEHPQYMSTPASIGEDLAFDKIVQSIDLYIKDNEEDTGKEPNVSTDQFWMSPSIWYRNNDDNITTDEKPNYSSSHKSGYIYVTIHNRGKENYVSGKWLHLAWGLSSTAFSDAAWCGQEIKDEYMTGGRLEPVHIDAIRAGSSRTIAIPWQLPKIMDNFSTTPYEIYPCGFYAQISDSHIPEQYVEGKNSYNPRYNKRQAVKNLALHDANNLFCKGSVIYMRNSYPSYKSYSLELVPLGEQEQNSFPDMKVNLSLCPTIHNAWVRGGSVGEGYIKTNTPLSVPSEYTTISFNSSTSKLSGIKMQGYEYGDILINFTSSKIYVQSVINPEFTLKYDLIQRDENGKIIGGVRFHVKPRKNTSGLTITSAPLYDNNFSVSVAEELEHYVWTNENGDIIGDKSDIIVKPSIGNSSFTVTGMNEHGEYASGSYSFESNYGIKSLSSDPAGRLVIEFHTDYSNGGYVTLSSAQTGATCISEKVNSNRNIMTIDTSNLPSGIYVVSLFSDDLFVNSMKYSK